MGKNDYFGERARLATIMPASASDSLLLPTVASSLSMSPDASHAVVAGRDGARQLLRHLQMSLEICTPKLRAWQCFRRYC